MTPTHAVQIWTDGTNFAVRISDAHTIRIPLDRPDQLISMLQARRRSDLKIGTPGSPTQWNIDRERSDIEAAVANKQAETLQMLADLGL